MCVNWYDTDNPVYSISFDAEDDTTFYAGTNGDGGGTVRRVLSLSVGGIYTCSTNGDCTLSPSTGEAVISVAGGTGSVFWSLYAVSPFLYAGTSTSKVAFTSSTSVNWSETQLLYFPGSTLTTTIV